MRMKAIDARHIVTNLATHDPAQLQVVSGVRNAVGIVLPLIVGTAIGHVQTAVVMAVGALVAGLAGLSGPMVQRIRTMILAVLWMGLASFLGSIVGHSLVNIIILTMVSGFLAGLMVAISPQATQVGTLATMGLVIFSAFPTTPYFAMIQTIFVVSGGLLQLLFMIVFFIAIPPATEVKSVLAALRALSAYIEQPTRQNDLALSYAMAMAESQVRDSLLSADYRQYLWNILRNTQELRWMFADDILEGKTRSIPPVSEKIQITKLRAALDTATEALRQKSQDRLLNRPAIWPAWHAAKMVGAESVESSRPALYMDQSLQDLVTLAKSPVTVGSRHVIGNQPHLLKSHHPILFTLRANLTGHSAAFRHALRMTVILGIAVWLYGLLSLPRGYWVPLTTLVILKPDFFSTIIRGIARVLGTIGGVVIATALFALPIHSILLTLIALVLFAIGLYTVFSYNYTLFSMFMTAEIVIMLSFFDRLSPVKTIEARTVDTLIGAALAFFAYFLWPRWQRTSLTSTIADLVQSERLYFQFLIAFCESPALTQDQTAFYQQQIQLARTNALSSLNHVLSRRDKRPVDAESAAGLLTALRRFDDALQVVRTYCVQKPLRTTVTRTSNAMDLAKFSRSMAEMLEAIEHALRTDLNPLSPSLLAQFVNLQPRPGCLADSHECLVVQALYEPIGTMMRMLPEHHKPD
ncbi:MAG: hypothetical protein C7B44_07890 [Sulfobacillus thermosulfidooxidans]|nr:MAG: hypothetical protein C7B44_07890 [Sulfobacillus thermosulfidooxidans]